MLGFSNLMNIEPLLAGVTNKSKTKEPRHSSSAKHVLCPKPIDGTTVKQTTPQVSLIN
jgi:hypothetical protein